MHSNYTLMSASGFNWYGFIIGGGIIICLLLAHQFSKERGYYKDLVFDIAIICIPLAIVGARLYYVIFDIIGAGNSWTFKEILGIGSGGLSGLAIYGGLIGAVLGAIIIHFWKRNKTPDKKVTLMQLLDLGFTFIILGQAIGRWGNFANGEAFGRYIGGKGSSFFPIGVWISPKSGGWPNATHGEGYYQATFFYESLWNIAGFVLLAFLYRGKRKSFDGFIFSVYCIYYGIGRTWIEGLRTDSLMITSGLRVSQLLSILLIIFGIAYILIHIYRAQTYKKKPFIFVEQSLLSNKYFGYSESMLSHPNIYPKRGEKPLSESGAEETTDEFYENKDSGEEKPSDEDDFYKTDENLVENEYFSEEDAEKYFAKDTEDFSDEDSEN